MRKKRNQVDIIKARIAMKSVNKRRLWMIEKALWMFVRLTTLLWRWVVPIWISKEYARRINSMAYINKEQQIIPSFQMVQSML